MEMEIVKNESSLALLFSIVNKAEELCSCSIANLAFVCLIEAALEYAPREVRFLWASDSPKEYITFPAWYDLAIISDGLRQASIPAWLLKEDFAKGLMQGSEVVCKDDFPSFLPEANWQKLPNLINELNHLFDSLISVYPHALRLWDKYMKHPFEFDFEQAQDRLEKCKKQELNCSIDEVEPRVLCGDCPYYYGQDRIHCAPHPHGYPDHGCEELPQTYPSSEGFSHYRLYGINSPTECLPRYFINKKQEIKWMSDPDSLDVSDGGYFCSCYISYIPRGSRVFEAASIVGGKVVSWRRIDLNKFEKVRLRLKNNENS